MLPGGNGLEVERGKVRLIDGHAVDEQGDAVGPDAAQLQSVSILVAEGDHGAGDELEDIREVAGLERVDLFGQDGRDGGQRDVLGGLPDDQDLFGDPDLFLFFLFLGLLAGLGFLGRERRRAEGEGQKDGNNGGELERGAQG